jgi:hypothetical protein
MWRYVDYNPAQHGGQTLYQTEGFSLPDGGWDVRVREVKAKAEIAAAQQDPFGYSVLIEVPGDTRAWRAASDAQVRRVS